MRLVHARQPRVRAHRGGALVSGTIGVVGQAVGAVGGGIAALAPDLADAQVMLQDQLAVSDDDLDELESPWNDPDAREDGLILGALITWIGARAGAPVTRAETTRA